MLSSDRYPRSPVIWASPSLNGWNCKKQARENKCLSRSEYMNRTEPDVNSVICTLCYKSHDYWQELFCKMLSSSSLCYFPRFGSVGVEGPQEGGVWVQIERAVDLGGGGVKRTMYHTQKPMVKRGWTFWTSINYENILKQQHRRKGGIQCTYLIRYLGGLGLRYIFSHCLGVGPT